MVARGHLLAAASVAAAAFALYHATLLPGFDFGDTPSLQVTVGSPFLTPRDAYPLYFAIGAIFLRVNGGGPARALNVASAVEAAVACGFIALAGAELSGSLAAGLGAALLFAASYTFWSQAVIAEVYALHMLFVSLTLLLLMRWEARPTPTGLAAFFLVYALGFSNHLSMILLAPGYAMCVIIATPNGWRSPRVVALAIGCAAAGALPYLWNLHTLWLLPQPPHGLVEGLQRFWFDVTKSDWRDTMVMNVPRMMLRNRLAMYWFDLQQQFGRGGAALAVVGVGHLAFTNRRRAFVIVLLYAANVAFALGYNVGDAHVFFLPSHLMIALLAACGAVAIVRGMAFLVSLARPGLARRVLESATPLCGALLVVYAGYRAYCDYPALDRSHDQRPAEVLDRLTAGLDGLRAIFLTDLNWQVQNGFTYFADIVRPDIATARLADVLIYAPALVADNAAIGRDVVLTERAATTLATAYGPLLQIAPDPRVPVHRLPEAIRDLPVGTRYVLCLLRPARDARLDSNEVADMVRLLTGGRSLSLLADRDYSAVAGRIGDAPRYIAASTVPFRRRVDIGGVAVDVRMESWLAFDTIRRMGFGHVIAGRRHTLIVERGLSFVAFDERGEAIRTVYAANIFAPQRRYVVKTPVRLKPDATSESP